MATATVLYQHNWSADGIHTLTTKSKKLWIPATSPLALLLISCFVYDPHAWSLPFSKEDSSGSG